MFYFWLFMFSCSRNAQVTTVKKPQLKRISFKNYKHWYLIHTWSNTDFKCTVVNRALTSVNWLLLETTLKDVPLTNVCKWRFFSFVNKIFRYRVSHETWQLVNSFGCRLPYTVLGIKGCLQFISFNKSFAQIYFTLKLTSL